MIREIRRIHRSLLEQYPARKSIAVVIVRSTVSSPTVIEPGFRDVLRLDFDDDLPSVDPKTPFSKAHAERFVQFIRCLRDAPDSVDLIIQGETATLRRAAALALFARAYCGARYPDFLRSHDCCRSVLSVLRERCPGVTVGFPPPE